MTFDQLIQWHPYPAEKPERDARYIVTKRWCDGDGVHVIWQLMYSPKYDRWNFTDNLDPKKHPEDNFTDYVIAWAEMPQVTPYEG